jgi:hypothetical protein
MTKEQIFTELKSLVLTLRDDKEKFLNDAAFRDNWVLRQKSISDKVDKLDSCDANWLNDEYG